MRKCFIPAQTIRRMLRSLKWKSGAEVFADVRVTLQQMHRIRGRVVGPARTTRRCQYISSPIVLSMAAAARLHPAGITIPPQVYLNCRTLRRAITCCRLPSRTGGLYRRERDRFRGPAGALAAQARAETPIRLGDADLDGVVLTLSTGTSISGHLTIEGGALAGTPGADRIRVALRPMWSGLPNTTGPPANSSPVATDGSFRIDNVRDSEYLIAVNGIPSGLYLKRAVVGGQDILAAPFLFSANAGGNLEVVLGTNPARLQGRIVDAQGRPAVAAQVVLVPVQRFETIFLQTNVDGSEWQLHDIGHRSRRVPVIQLGCHRAFLVFRSGFHQGIRKTPGTAHPPGRRFGADRGF